MTPRPQFLIFKSPFDTNPTRIIVEVGQIQGVYMAWHESKKILVTAIKMKNKEYYWVAETTEQVAEMLGKYILND